MKKSTSPRTPFATKNDLPVKTREGVADLLNQTIADLSDLRSQTKHAHWNVHGVHFYSLHKLFDELAALVEAHLDPLAERIVTLGGSAQGTIRQAAANTSLKEFPEAPKPDLGFAEILSDRFSTAAANTRKQIDEAAELGDADTADLLTALSQDLDKGLWFLEAHFRGERE